MATQSRHHCIDLRTALEREPHRFRFFQAIRILALAAGPGADAPVPSQLRFRTPVTLAFPASEILTLAPRARSSPAKPLLEMEVGFLGLTGPSGILPQHYTETLLERRHLHRDTTLHAFLDLFNHRACCLFYAAWAKYRFHIAYELGPGDGFTAQLAKLLTVRPPPGANPAGIPEKILVHFAGLLAHHPLPSCSLEAFLATYFQVPVRLESFVGQWTPVPPPGQSRLGHLGVSLGQGAFLGQRFWDQETKVRLCLGPLAEPQFRDFLPGRPGAEALRQFVTMAFGKLLACDLELALTGTDLARPRLSGGERDAPRLGLDSWLHSRPVAGHPSPVAFRLQA